MNETQQLMRAWAKLSIGEGCERMRAYMQGKSEIEQLRIIAEANWYYLSLERNFLGQPLGATPELRIVRDMVFASYGALLQPSNVARGDPDVSTG